MKKKVAILASGNGTNAENIIRYFSGSETACVNLLIANRKDAYALERAKRLGVPSVYMGKDEWKEGANVLGLLRREGVDFVVLAGFLARVPQAVIDAFPRRIVNIHPALLPKFGGKGMYGSHVHEAVLAAGEKESGITIHYINEHYDEGDIVAQFRCEVLPGDTPDELASRVHALEYKHFPEVIERLVTAL